jgi:hypothetical protein
MDSPRVILSGMKPSIRYVRVAWASAALRAFVSRTTKYPTTPKSSCRCPGSSATPADPPEATMAEILETLPSAGAAVLPAMVQADGASALSRIDPGILT